MENGKCELPSISHFPFAIFNQVRTLAIDLGSRRVGLAMGDDESKIATPYDVIEVSTPDQATHRVLEIIKSESIDRILLGLPLNMDDTHGPAAQQTIKWGT